MLDFLHYRGKFRFILALLVFGATEPAWADSVAPKNLFGRLPVYHVPRGNPRVWVHQNAVHFLKSAMNFSAIYSRIDSRLSSACALGRFNQRRDKAFFVVARYQKKNVIILGYVHGRGVNLHDPTGIADPTIGYLFRYDRSGKCQVFMDQ